MPTLLPGQAVIGEKLSPLLFGFRIGDIAVIKSADGRKIIKRIIGKTGDDYFVAGDNKNYSTDSRQFGLVGKNDIISKIIKL